jgi:AcrR family transcriptional regulator
MRPRELVMATTHGAKDHKDQTRERLITAGLELLATKGYRAATSRDISRAAGVTEVTMYRHFCSKDELFTEAIRQYRHTLLGLVPEPSGNLWQDLHTLVERFYTHIAVSTVKSMQVIPELNRHCEAAKPEGHLLQVELNRRLCMLFRYYQTSGELTQEAGDHIVTAFLGPIYYYAAQDNTDRNTYLESGKYVTFFLKGYGVSPGTAS